MSLIVKLKKHLGRNLFVNGKDKNMVQEIDASTLAQWLKSGEAVVIDVRENDEFSGGHIEGAVSLPLSVFPQKFDRSRYPADKKVVLQCQGGVRSMKACQIAQGLAEKEHVLNLSGGLNAWRSAGLPIVR